MLFQVILVRLLLVCAGETFLTDNSTLRPVQIIRSPVQILFPANTIHSSARTVRNATLDFHSSRTIFHRKRRKYERISTTARSAPSFNLSTVDQLGTLSQHKRLRPLDDETIFIPDGLVFEPHKDLSVLYPNSHWLDPCKALLGVPWVYSRRLMHPSGNAQKYSEHSIYFVHQKFLGANAFVWLQLSHGPHLPTRRFTVVVTTVFVVALIFL
ncbi:uncharacterized protein DEA37_0009103 [Paragonimus westermani]|uniref:Uncharacterized protein n=1 Tax=Paragonimus westermani TaxID=34504 RepID=A0A5J4P2A9_9TREM|nr:uncharacterized protein DEA37_0009103 [Paragonimus westermani]